MPEGTEKQQKQNLFNEWKKQLTSSSEGRIILSQRDMVDKFRKYRRREWGINPVERVHEKGKPKPEKEEIKEGIDEYYKRKEGSED